MSEERAPLLGDGNRNGSSEAIPTITPSASSSSTFSPVSNSNGQFGQPYMVSVEPIGPDELPPPYSPVNGGVPMVACRVCGSMVDITGKRDQHVVKCDNCNEATPIKNAPTGKKYVRCPCHCLLVCKASALRIACPRPQCKRIINLTQNSMSSNMTNHTMTPIPGMCRVICSHCQDSFLFNTLQNKLARCPHCRRLSSVGHEFARTRGLVFIVMTVVFIAIALAVIFGTKQTIQNGSSGLIALDVILALIVLLLLMRAVYYLTIKVSTIESTT